MCDPVDQNREQLAAAISELKDHGDNKKMLLSVLPTVEHVCVRCLLCIAGFRSPSLFAMPVETVRAAMLSIAQPGAGGAQEGKGEDGQCAACFGILLKPVQHFVDTVKQNIVDRGYDLDSVRTIMLSLSVPSSVIIRQHCVRSHLDKAVKAAGGETNMVEMKEAFRWIYADAVLGALNAKLEQNSMDDATGRLKITAEYRHEETSSEKEAVLAGATSRRQVRGPRERGQRRGEMQEIENTNAVIAELNKHTPPQLQALYPWPLKLAASACELAVKLERESTFVGGAYCKYSREVSQSPWNEAHGDLQNSVQTLILRTLGPLFGASETKFIGSGREDVDVRMLGGGRPFLLEIVDAKRLPVAPHFNPGEGNGAGGQSELYASIEKSVNESTDLIQVNRLRAEGRKYAELIKGSAETKRKTYKALVWTAAPIQADAIQKLKGVKDLVINQSTPIRVLHRRSVAVRQRTVHNLQIEVINQRFLLLQLQTEAGTYVKEFVHGDLGRTQPSLGGLLGCEADILQLDVMEVEL